MRKIHVLTVTAVFAGAAILAGCSPRSSMNTLQAATDSETSAVFSLTKVLDLGTNYLVNLDYSNAILQYVEIIEHDPQNKEAYAGLYAAYAANGDAEKAAEVLQQAREAFDDEDAILDTILDDAALIMENGGGDDVYHGISDHYIDLLNEDNAIYLENIGNSWKGADPTSEAAYDILAAVYAYRGDEDAYDTLMKDAEENGISTQKMVSRSGITIDSSGMAVIPFGTDKNGKQKTVKVKIEATDDAAEVVDKVTSAVTSQAAKDVVEQSGLTGQAAEIAQSMAQQALDAGLGKSSGNTGSGQAATPQVTPSAGQQTQGSQTVTPEQAAQAQKTIEEQAAQAQAEAEKVWAQMEQQMQSAAP